MIKAVIFDLDDTLFPEEQYVLSGFKAVAAKTKADYKKLVRLYKEDKNNVFDRYWNNDAPFAVQEFHGIYVNHFPEINLYGDAMVCLKELKGEGYKLGLITDGRIKQQNNKIDALNIRKYFDAVILSDEYGVLFRKPHIKPFEETRDKLGVNYDEMIYVGDNPAKDFYISEKTEIQTVHILRDGLYKHREFYKSVKPHYVIKSLKELNDILKQN